MTKRTSALFTFGLGLLLLTTSACTDDSGSDDELGETGSDTGSESDDTGSESDDTGSETEQAQPLAPAELVGDWASSGCEAYPDGMGNTNYLTRSFTLTEDSWHLDLGIFADEACTVPLIGIVIDGPYTLLELSTIVDGATEGNFGFDSIVWTAHTEAMATTFTDAGCGSAPWVVGEAQDVSETGCIGIAHAIAECPTDHDIVSLVGDELFFGQRVTDMCTEAGRPTALNAYPVVRQ